MLTLPEKYPYDLENKGKSVSEKPFGLAHNEYRRPNLHVSHSVSWAWEHSKSRTYTPLNIMLLIFKQEGNPRVQCRQISKYKHHEG